MKSILFLLLSTLTLSSCHYEYKQCEFNSSDGQLKIYNDILNELVEQNSANSYLGEKLEEIHDEYNLNPADSIKIRNKIIKRQNELYDDPTQQCTVFLDTVYRAEFSLQLHLLHDTTKYTAEIITLITSFSSDGQIVIDSLNSIQKRFKPEDFHLCTSKVRSVRDINNPEIKCGIGIVSLSKVFLDTSKYKGLLIYNFYCGDMCGYGLLLEIEKVNNRWVIIKKIRTWIS